MVADVIVVGTGVMGASVAFHLAERGIDTLVVDRDGPAAGSTARSGALIRCHYPTVLEADLAWESLTDYFELWGERVGGGCGFTQTGFAFLASSEDSSAVKSNVAMLREHVGIDTELVSPAELNEIDPALETGDVVIAAYEPRSGYADPNATTISLLRAAQDFGAQFKKHRVVSLLERGNRISGVETEDKLLECQAVVLAAGAWSTPLAASIGLELPIRAARVQVALFERPYSLPTHLTMIDAATHAYSRPTADHCTLVGSRTAERQWLEDPDGCDPEPDAEFVEQAGKRVGRRIPQLRGAPYRSGRAGVLDMTPDDRPILGPEGPEGLYLSVGWSGAGFKKAPAVGAELARWVSDGTPRRDELNCYNLARFEKGNLIRGEHEYSSTGPH